MWAPWLISFKETDFECYYYCFIFIDFLCFNADLSKVSPKGLRYPKSEIYLPFTKVSAKVKITEQFHVANQFFSKRVKLRHRLIGKRPRKSSHITTLSLLMPEYELNDLRLT